MGAQAGKKKGRADDHRTRVSKLLIRQAFMQLLRRKPMRDISIKELCEAAGINRSTFYAHYTDLGDLLRRIEEEMLAEFEQAMSPLLEESEKSFNPVAISAAIFRCLKDNSDLCTVTLGEYGDKAFLSRLLSIGRERCIATYLKHYPHASPRQIEYFYAFASAGCIGLLRKWLDDGMAVSAEEVARAAEALMLRGIGALEHPADGEPEAEAGGRAPRGKSGALP